MPDISLIHLYKNQGEAGEGKKERKKARSNDMLSKAEKGRRQVEKIMFDSACCGIQLLASGPTCL